MCDLGAHDRGHRARSADRAAQRRARGARPRRSGRTTGCRTSGSRPTACPASRSRSTSRTRGWRSSSSRRCSKSKAAIPNRACGSCGTRPGHAIDNAYQLRRRPTRRRLFGTPGDAVSRVLHAEAVQQELRPAPRSLVRAEPSRRRLRRDVRRLARSRTRCGRRATPAGRRSGSSSTWIG